ncbi:MAG: DUF167 domain-containing protein [Alphaproteobacteria bacterium]|nr:DUF167 domain-containing protein [Alphaproteobacteria bacterium]
MSVLGRATGDGLVIPVRLTPKASRNVVEGVRRDAAGAEALAARVTAVPEKGKANRALEKLLAKALGVAAGRVSVVAGAASRDKEVLVRGDPDEIAGLLAKLTGETDV